MPKKVIKSDKEWQALLTPAQFQVMRKGATERPFTGEFWKSKAKGFYKCACCNTLVFGSEHKFDAGSGWPSFTRALYDERVLLVQESSGDGRRHIVVKCDCCGGSLGLFFDGGPPPTGKRYSINSLALKFDPEVSSGAKKS